VAIVRACEEDGGWVEGYACVYTDAFTLEGYCNERCSAYAA